jgi:hypothetical protein
MLHFCSWSCCWKRPIDTTNHTHITLRVTPPVTDTFESETYFFPTAVIQMQYTAACKTTDQLLNGYFHSFMAKQFKTLQMQSHSKISQLFKQG